MLGTNEGEYPWMDEGFTSYAEDRVQAFLDNASGFLSKEVTMAITHW
jgi:hypothetical protein